jgi:hypothetical protein
MVYRISNIEGGCQPVFLDFSLPTISAWLEVSRMVEDIVSVEIGEPAVGVLSKNFFARCVDVSEPGLGGVVSLESQPLLQCHP